VASNNNKKNTISLLSLSPSLSQYAHHIGKTLKNKNNMTTPSWDQKVRLCVAGLYYNPATVGDDHIVKWQAYFTGSRYRHVELYFENVIDPEDDDEEEAASLPINVSYTVNKTTTTTTTTTTADATDSEKRQLFRDVGKTFSRDDWFVVSLTHAATQYEEYVQKVYRCLEYCRVKYDQGAGYNHTGENYFKAWPVSGYQQTFFCSEFVLYALIYAGFVPDGIYRPHELHPGNIMNIATLLLHGVEDSQTLTKARGIQGAIQYD
jgi:hypothetical protein